jgi:hypothetical protein
VVVNPTAGVAHAVPVLVALQSAAKTTTALNDTRHVHFLGTLSSISSRILFVALSRTGTMEQITGLPKM